LGDQIDNDVVTFVPDGSEVTKIRDVARTADCNKCHDPLAIHGGVRRDVELCVMCHYSGVDDPDTGNTVDMAVMIHKIHRGQDLPSVQAGTPYQIIGFRQSVHDYSEVAFPQDIRNCDSCHGQDATQGMAYILRPSRAACGSCHDDVDFATGENHVGGPAISDNFCANCHFPEGEFEFDASVIGAHTIPANSRQLEGIDIEIADVTGTGPGETPTVFFTVQTNDGDPIPPSSFPLFNLLIAGPTDDYSFLASERAVEAAVPAGEGFMYTFDAAIPADAEGTFAVGAEAFRNVLLNAGTVVEFSFRETAENPVFYFGVTDAEPLARRVNVMDANCESCHKNLALHGSIRHNGTEYCQMCHQAAADDSPFRQEGTPRTIDFKFLIHRLHTGHELTRDYTVIGFMGSENNYNELHYPGDLRNCAKCHQNDSYEIPSQGILPTVDGNEFFSPIAPNAAACLGCHDSAPAAAHAFLNIAPFAEACAACHGPNSEFSVARVHSR
ncbi:MAG: OmcA/MtrC family decaheme c-type cytochrome, partial [Acidobacteriota bacterium]